MRLLNLVGNSFGCSASGERLVSAARDGDLQEARALLEYNPRLVRYSTFGVRNSPLHYSAAQGHHEIVSLLLESGVDINLRNYRGQTALMQACQYGHWEVVQTLILFRANIHRADYLNGGTALHLAALNGHSWSIRLLLADYIPSNPNVWNILRKQPSSEKCSHSELERINNLSQVINRPADGGVTALHMAALNGHVESVQLLLDLGASVSEVTVEDGTTIDLIGAGSTPLHYAACGGNAECCQILIANGASLSAENSNRLTPLMVARSWNRDWLEEILTRPPEEPSPTLPSLHRSLPLMSIIKIARECGWRSIDSYPTCQDTCVVCLESKCAVAAEGCNHEFCTRCALYLCSMNTASTSHGHPGSVPCPLCRHGITSFTKLPGTRPIPKDIARTSLSLAFCTCSGENAESTLKTPLCKADGSSSSTRISPAGSSFRSLSCRRRFPSMRLNPSLCMGAPDTSSSLVPCTVDQNLTSYLARYSRSSLRRAASQSETRKSWFSTLNQCVATGGGC
ncbi:hypothetical protein SAY87_013781 [Trapa incisa]|uniref:RING-type E3 ubiquitin transferase n=1 Tax=Trapa incisa TaxID=236973 RepID=A0AAN7QDS9_9MYRT|nr:hypothetical protein SAY87_013781 [Trapa incisa]